MKYVDVKPDTYVNFPVESNIKNPNLRVMIMYESQTTKLYFQIF